MSDRYGTVTAISHSVELNSTEEQVFRAISEHENLSKWFLPQAKISLVRKGVEEENGSGAIRAVKTGPFIGEEEIIEFEAPRRLHYKVIKGLPIRHYLGRVTVKALTPGVTELTWAVEFEPAMWGVRPVLQAAINQSLKSGLARLPKYLRSMPAK